MTTDRPTILATGSVPGVTFSTLPTNLTWSDDGQAAFCNSRGVHIFTPNLISSLPPPPAYVDPEQAQAIKSQTQEIRGDADDVVMDDAEDEAGAGPSTSSSRARRIRRPKNGEVACYVNGVDEKEVDRTEEYEWTEVGDETSAIISEDEFRAKSVAWSPSGLSDLGGCLLAVTNNQGQVSIYAPAKDPYTKKWEEIADMTVLTRATLPRALQDPLTIPGMLQMRSTTLMWSRPIPLDSCLGIDLSLLAIANRAGKIIFWSYGQGRKFVKVLGAGVTSGWVTSMDWSSWTQIDQNSCGTGTPTSKVDIVKDEKVPDTDLRAINGLKWLDGLLVFSRPGSITLWSAQSTDIIKWSGTKRLVLPQVGNWAGANPLSPCIGVHSFSSDSILIVLSTHIHYVITDISTAPTLAEASVQLNLSIAARQTYLDQLQVEMFDNRQSSRQEPYVKSMTAHTGGWAAAGEAGVVAWFAEPTNFHNMEAAPEGQRRTAFCMADLGGFLPGRKPVLDALEELLEDPPLLIHTSPLRSLMPHLLRTISTTDQVGIASEVEDLLQSDMGAAVTSPSSRPTSATPVGPMTVLRRSLWGDKALNGLRLRYLFAKWSSTIFTESAKKFSLIAATTLKLIQDIVIKMQLEWAASVCQSKGRDLSPDMPLLQLLLKTAAGLSVPTGFRAVSDAISQHASTDDTSKLDLCPACGEEVTLGDANGTSRCTKGHEWSRCSITRYLITLPNYRVCSSCPAVSLMPASSTKPPIPVEDSGLDTDYKRALVRLSSRGAGDGLTMAEELLESAVVCVMCGGRWVRVF